MSVALNEMYKINSPNMENKHDMQFLKKKKRRRTKKEVEQEKLKNLNVKKIKKKLGRKLKIDNEKSEHTKKSDDNIISTDSNQDQKISTNDLDSPLIDNKNEQNGGEHSNKDLKKVDLSYICHFPKDLNTLFRGKIDNDLLEKEKHNSEFFVVKPSFTVYRLPKRLRPKSEDSKISNDSIKDKGDIRDTDIKKVDKSDSGVIKNMQNKLYNTSTSSSKDKTFSYLYNDKKM